MFDSANPPSLEKLVGQNILCRIPIVDEAQPCIVKLLSVEMAGIWIESQKVTEHFLSELKVSTAPKTLVYFVPFQHVAWILASGDYPALSEKALGV